MRTAIIVKPEIPENTGFIARLAANFDFSLRIVEPQFNLEEARKTAKNAQQKLREAEIYSSAMEATKDLDFVIGTKPGKGSSLNEFQPREDTSLMIGPESNGLSNNELDLCDATVQIQTSSYSSINQSHAAAILMHHFNEEKEGETATRKQLDKLEEVLPKSTYRLVKQASPSKKQAGEAIKEALEKEKES